MGENTLWFITIVVRGIKCIVKMTTEKTKI
jgi:hypothetical protein